MCVTFRKFCFGAQSLVTCLVGEKNDIILLICDFCFYLKKMQYKKCNKALSWFCPDFSVCCCLPYHFYDILGSMKLAIIQIYVVRGIKGKKPKISTNL